jgi:hypothetical protein
MTEGVSEQFLCYWEEIWEATYKVAPATDQKFSSRSFIINSSFFINEYLRNLHRIECRAF